MQTKQKQSNRNKTFCVILIWSIANIKLLSALQTPYCNHHRFESRLMKTLSCLENANREIGLGSERNIGCDDIDKVHSCTIDNIGTCFNEDIKNDLATILEMAKMEIAGNGSLIKKHLNPMSDINLTCERFTGPDKARVMNNAMALVQKYSQNLRNPKFLDSIITLDNKCSFEDLIDSFGELPQSPCVERNLMDVLLIFKEVTEIKNLGLNQRSNNFGNLQSPSSLCKEINEILNCVKPNECFSAQEVQLVKKLVLTMYKMLLKSVIKITDKSGGIDKVIDSLSMNPDIKTLYQQAGIDGNILKRMYELVLNDFESESCQRILPATLNVTTVTTTTKRPATLKVKNMATITNRPATLKVGNTATNSNDSATFNVANIATNANFLLLILAMIICVTQTNVIF